MEIMQIYQFKLDTKTGKMQKKCFACKETEKLLIIDKTAITDKYRINKDELDLIDNRLHNTLLSYTLNDDETAVKSKMLNFIKSKINIIENQMSELNDIKFTIMASMKEYNHPDEYRMKNYIAIDFDGTITVKNAFPEVGEPNWDVINRAKKEVAENNAILILHTCRENEGLTQAVDACKKWGVPITYVNENPECQYAEKQRKIIANQYWDDRAVNITDGKLYPDKLIGCNKCVD